MKVGDSVKIIGCHSVHNEPMPLPIGRTGTIIKKADKLSRVVYNWDFVVRDSRNCCWYLAINEMSLITPQLVFDFAMG